MNKRFRQHSGLVRLMLLVSLCFGCGLQGPSRTPTDEVHLQRDLGVVPPGSQTECQFVIANTASSGRWTFHKFLSSCSCTAAATLAKHIEHGSQEPVRLIYRAPRVCGDFLENVVVLFAEPTAPRVILSVRSRVRRLLTPFPQRLDFGSVPYKGASAKSIVLHNYSRDNWRSVRALTNAPWMNVSNVELESEGRDGGGLRQVWKLRVSTNLRHLGPGRHSASLRVIADNAALEEVEVPVVVYVSSPVHVVPAQLFFGKLQPFYPMTKAVTIEVPVEAGPTGAVPFRLEHDLRSRTRISEATWNGKAWILNVTLTLANTDRIVSGSLKILPLRDDFPTTVVPVYAAADSAL